MIFSPFCVFIDKFYVSCYSDGGKAFSYLYTISPILVSISQSQNKVFADGNSFRTYQAWLRDARERCRNAAISAGIETTTDEFKINVDNSKGTVIMFSTNLPKEDLKNRIENKLKESFGSRIKIECG